MPPSPPRTHPDLGLVGKVRRRIVSADTGECVFDSGYQKTNLILDQFFFDLSQTSGNINTIAGILANGSIQAGTLTTNPIRKDSTPTTLSQSGTTVTASASFFASGDVGQLLVFGASGSGTNACYITGYTNSTTVTVSVSQTVASVVGTVWYVGFLGLSGSILTLNTKATASGDWSTAYSAGVYTYTATFQSAVQSSPYTAAQLAYRDSNNNRVLAYLIPGAGDTIPTNYFYVVTWSIAMTVTPSAPTAVTNIGTGINTAGNAMVESTAGFSTLNSSGAYVAGTGAVADGYGSMYASAQGILTADTYVQNASVAASGSEPVLTNLNGYEQAVTLSASNPANTGTAILTMTSAFNTTGTGAVITALGIIYSTATKRLLVDDQLTSTYTSPSSGSFTFALAFTTTIGRTVIN